MSQPNPHPQSSNPIPPKRNRTQLSCTACRHGKLKCDRGHPCSQCLKRGRPSACIFPEPAPRRRPAVSMRDRVRHLEGLVKGVMGDGENGGSGSGGGRGGGEKRGDGEKESRGSVLVNEKEGESTYVGATHWAAILEDIEEVKDYFASADGDDDDERDDEGEMAYTMLTFNPYSPATKGELIEMLPERSVVDRLIARYFNSHSPSLHLIHRPTFLKEYKKFWAAPSEAPIIWIGLMYALMGLATFAALGAGEQPPSPGDSQMENIRGYRNCCMQALVLSHYTKPGPYTLETLIMYMEGEFLMSKGNQAHLYLLIGNIVRLSLRMGLHRDATKIGGNITPFQAEIRRRIWHHLGQIDLLGSFHIGLPGTIEAIESDTLLPRNLRDEDWNDEMAELPPSRPESELTTTSYLICKSRLTNACGKIAAFANRLTLPPYEEVMRMDGVLRDAFDKVPSFFQMPSEFPIFESPEIIIRQFSIALVYQKSRCMLHRKYIIMEGDKMEYAYSKETALDASMELLKYQRMSYEAILPGGPFARDRYVLSTLTMHDFLLASMIVSINITQATSRNSSNGVGSSDKKYQKMAEALEKSYNIFLNMGATSAEAKKASALLRAMLNKINKALGQTHVSEETPIAASKTSNGNGDVAAVSSLSLYDQSPPRLLPKYDMPTQDSWQPGLPSDTTSSSSIGFQLDESQALIPPVPGDLLGDMIEMPDNIDWDAFDNQIFPQPTIYEAWPNLTSGDPVDFAFGDIDQSMLNNDTI